jgi:hypothetical protein
VEASVEEAKSDSLAWAALPPLGLASCYLGLILFFKTRGGYRPVELDAKPDDA